MIKLVLADDHQILRESVRKNFESAGEQVIGEASNGEDAVRLAQQLEPDVVVMDISMPVLDGVSATRRISESVPGTRVVVLTMHDDIDKVREQPQRVVVRRDLEHARAVRLGSLIKMIECRAHLACGGARADDDKPGHG